MISVKIGAHRKEDFEGIGDSGKCIENGRGIISFAVNYDS